MYVLHSEARHGYLRKSASLSSSSASIFARSAFSFAPSASQKSACPREREFFIDNLLVRIHLIIEMIFGDRPCAMGV